MTVEPRGAQWETHHIAYGSPRERCERLFASAARLRGIRWWWADVFTTVPVLEISVSPTSSLPVLVGTGESGEPLTLQSRLFPLGRVPEWFAPVLADTGLRAASVLATAPSCDEPVSWSSVRTELQWLYGELVPDAAERSSVLMWHEAWLRARASHAPSNMCAAWLPANSGGDVHMALVARVAHVQVVRLRGPQSDLLDEVELIQSLRLEA